MKAPARTKDDALRAKLQDVGQTAGSRFAEASAVATAAGALMLGASQAQAARDERSDDSSASPAQPSHSVGDAQSDSAMPGTVTPHTPQHQPGANEPAASATVADPEVEALVARIAEHIATGLQTIVEGALSGAPLSDLGPTLASDIISQARAITDELRPGNGTQNAAVGDGIGELGGNGSPSSVYLHDAISVLPMGSTGLEDILQKTDALQDNISSSVSDLIGDVGTLSDALLSGGGQFAGVISDTVDDLLSDTIIASLLHGGVTEVADSGPVSALVANLQGNTDAAEPESLVHVVTEVAALPEDVLGATTTGDNPLAAIFYDDGAAAGSLTGPMASLADAGSEPVKLGFLGQALDFSNDLGALNHSTNALHL